MQWLWRVLIFYFKIWVIDQRIYSYNFFITIRGRENTIKYINNIFFTTLVALSLTSTAQATSRDLIIARAAIYSTLGSYIYMYLQDDNDFTVPLWLDLQHPSISLSYGKEFSDKPGRHLENCQLSFGVDWEKILIERQHFILTGHTEFNINRWYSTKKSSQNHDGFIYSITPVFTYTFKNIDILNHNLYLETGIGFAFMDNTKVEDREKSTHFQFTDSIGLGFTSKSYKFGYRFTHVSNLGIEKPNPSMDLHQIQISYKF